MDNKPTRRGFLGRLAGIVAAGAVAPKVVEAARPSHMRYAAPQNIGGISEGGLLPRPDTIWMNTKQLDTYLKYTGVKPRVLTEGMLVQALHDARRRR